MANTPHLDANVENLAEIDSQAFKAMDGTSAGLCVETPRLANYPTS